MVRRTFALENIWNIKFFTLPLQSCCSCDKFNLFLSWTRFWKKHPNLNALSRDLKYFDDIDLVSSLDNFQVCSNFNMFTRNWRKKPVYLQLTQSQGLFLFAVNILQFQQTWKLVRYFCLYSTSKKSPILVSAHAQNFFS